MLCQHIFQRKYQEHTPTQSFSIRVIVVRVCVCVWRHAQAHHSRYILLNVLSYIHSFTHSITYIHRETDTDPPTMGCIPHALNTSSFLTSHHVRLSICWKIHEGYSSKFHSIRIPLNNKWNRHFYSIQHFQCYLLNSCSNILWFKNGENILTRIHSNVDSFPELFNAQTSQTIPTMWCVRVLECKRVYGERLCICVSGGWMSSTFVLSLWSSRTAWKWFIQFRIFRVVATSYSAVLSLIRWLKKKNYAIVPVRSVPIYRNENTLVDFWIF